MNKKIITSLMLALLSSHAHALFISNGKVLSHKEWSDQDVTVTRSDVQSQQIPTMTKKIREKDLGFSMKTNEVIGVSNLIDQATGVINQKTKLIGGVKTYIENISHQTHIYAIESMMCANVTRSCTYAINTIELAPGGKAHAREALELFHTYKKKGRNLIYIATWIKRKDSSTVVQTDSVNVVDVVSR